MILINDTVNNTSDFPDKIFENGLSIYEVVRVFKNKPIFLKDNLIRLANSIKKSNLDIDIENLHIPDKLTRLIQLENIQEGNIKYILHAGNDNRIDEYIYQIPHSYPTEENYRNGVTTITCRAMRENPGIKYINGALRAQTNQLMERNHAYEVLLIDDEGYITEGSRSNVFFIKDDILYTASTDYVLPGTSRKRVIDICKKHHITVLENRVAYQQISKYESAFITGTSPLILPIHFIDGVEFNPRNELLKKVMNLYFLLLENAI